MGGNDGGGPVLPAAGGARCSPAREAAGGARGGPGREAGGGASGDPALPAAGGARDGPTLPAAGGARGGPAQEAASGSRGRPAREAGGGARGDLALGSPAQAEAGGRSSPARAEAGGARGSPSLPAARGARDGPAWEAVGGAAQEEVGGASASRYVGAAEPELDAGEAAAWRAWKAATGQAWMTGEKEEEGAVQTGEGQTWQRLFIGYSDVSEAYEPITEWESLNLAECLNNWLKRYKSLNLDDLMDKIRQLIMIKWNQRRKSRELQLEAEECSEEVAEVTVLGGSGFRFVINLQERTCSCRKWQVCGIPCQHTLAFITSLPNAFIEDYVDQYYFIDKFRAAYSQLIHAMPDKSQWPKPTHAIAGRSKTERYKECTESKKKKRMHKCPICIEYGGPPKKKAKTIKSAHSSIVPVEDEAPVASMSFPPKHMSRSGSNQPEPITFELPSSGEQGPSMKKTKGKGKKKLESQINPLKIHTWYRCSRLEATSHGGRVSTNETTNKRYKGPTKYELCTSLPSTATEQTHMACTMGHT
ncbi:hypothetical protein U9M48_015804 [Paspalum notatum var. saurae]|uniref:SWIM-type domain-containing protein n=1 Tax=Paspalum notatum var. saurae TaxID=547442 RepID=A0AAQ3WM68_PASNO